MYCVVEQCKSIWKPNSGIKFHSFPKDEKKKKKWLSSIPIKSKLYSSAKICSLHFQPKDYDPNRPGRLINSAIPFYQPNSCDCVSILTENNSIKPSTSAPNPNIESASVNNDTKSIEILQHKLNDSKNIYTKSKSLEPSTIAPADLNIKSGSLNNDTTSIEIFQHKLKENFLFTALTSPRNISSRQVPQPGPSQLTTKGDTMGEETKPCRCCRAQGIHKDFNSTCSWLDQTESYASILQDCFNIVLSSSSHIGNGICDECVKALHAARSFKQTVLHTEQELMNVCTEIDLKPEVVKVELDSDDDHLDDCSLADAVQEEQMELSPTVVSEDLQKRGFRRPEAAGGDSGDVGRLLTKLSTIQNNELTIRKEKVTKVANNLQRFESLSIKNKGRNVKNVSKAKPQQNSHKLQTVEPIKVLNRETKINQSSVQNKFPNFLTIKTVPKQITLKTTNSPTKSTFIIDNSLLDKHRSNIRQILLCSNATPIKRGGLSYSCCYCTQHFANPQTLKRHNLDEHDIEKRGAYKVTELRKFVVNLDITSLKCKLCNNDVEKLDELLAHLKNDHNKEIYLHINNHIIPFKFEDDKLKCVLCGNEYFAFKKLQEHMNSHYRNYECKRCSAGFVTFGRLYSHLRAHQEEEANLDFKCSLCSKSFKTNVRLKNHSKIHKGFNITCAFCGESFKEFKDRYKHLSEVHGVQFQAFECHACDKTYKTSSALTAHVKRHHLVERNFACTECDLKFFSRQILEMHMVSHTGARDFQCEICSKKFGRKKTLKEHLRIHLNDRRYECCYCGQAFVQKVSLRCHLRSKHGDKV